MINPNKFPEYAHMKLERFKRGFHDTECEKVEQDKDDLRSVIFAKSEVTGYPTTDVAQIMSKDSNPQVAQYVRDNLMYAREVSGGIDDPDFALQMIPQEGEDFAAYGERVRSLIIPKNTDE